MKLGWLLFQYAPPDLKLSRAQKREARRRTWKIYRPTPGSIATILGAALTLGVIYSAAILLLDPLYLGRLYVVFMLIGPVVVIALTWLITAWAGNWIYSRAHRQALRDMGFEICTNCAYWLRDLPPKGTHCPECGETRTEETGRDAEMPTR